MTETLYLTRKHVTADTDAHRTNFRTLETWAEQIVEDLLTHTHDGLAPAGGAAGEVLTKDSGTDYDYSWQPASGGGGGFYQLFRDGGTDKTARGKANFVDSADITFTLTDDAANDETEVTAAFAANMATQAELDAHINDTTDAHDASAISYAGATGIVATDVEAAIDEVVAEAVMDGDTAGGVLSGTYPSPGFAVDMATQAELDAHLTDATDAHDASAISYVGGTGMSATDVEAAIDELANEKANSADLKYQIIRDAGIDETQRGALNFVDTADITFNIVDDAGANETEVQASFAANMATQAELDAHVNDLTDAHDASAISYAGTTGIAATDVEAAIDEVVTEAVMDGDAAGGDLAGTYPSPTIGTDKVTDAKLRNSGALSVIGRSANSAGDPADISATALSGGVLREESSVLGFGQVATGGILDNAVTYAKMANFSAESCLLGRGQGAGTGDPEQITLGTNLSMTGTTLNATGGGASDLDDLTDVVITTPASDEVLTYNGTEWVNAEAQGTLSFHGCRVYRSAARSPASGAAEDLLFDAETFDTDAYHPASGDPDQRRVTIPSGLAGYYRITARCNWAANATNRRLLRIRKNGTTDLAEVAVPGNASTSVDGPEATVTANLAVGDYITMEIEQNSGAGLAVTVGEDTCYMEVIKLGIANTVPPNTLYEPGNVTVQTGNFQLHANKFQLNSTENLTLEGTAMIGMV